MLYESPPTTPNHCHSLAKERGVVTVLLPQVGFNSVAANVPLQIVLVPALAVCSVGTGGRGDSPGQSFSGLRSQLCSHPAVRGVMHLGKGVRPG